MNIVVFGNLRVGAEAETLYRGPERDCGTQVESRGNPCAMYGSGLWQVDHFMASYHSNIALVLGGGKKPCSPYRKETSCTILSCVVGQKERPQYNTEPG